MMRLMISYVQRIKCFLSGGGQPHPSSLGEVADMRFANGSDRVGAVAHPVGLDTTYDDMSLLGE